MYPHYWDSVLGGIPHVILKNIKYSKICSGPFLANVAEFGADNREIVLIVPPAGSTLLILAPLASFLSDRYRVICFESQGCPDVSEDLPENAFFFDFQLQRINAILTAKAIESAHVILWCQAANLFCSRFRNINLNMKSLTLVSPWGIVDDGVKSPFESVVRPIYLEASKKGIENASMLSKVLTALNKSKGTPFSAENMVLLHSECPEATLRFSHYSYATVEGSRCVSQEGFVAASKATPTLIIHCKDDEYADYRSSFYAYEVGFRVRLLSFEKGGHFIIFNSPEIIGDAIRRFIEGV